MKKNYYLKRNINVIKINATKLCLFLAIVLSSILTQAQQVTYSFSSAGALGRLGPTQGQINTAYATTNLNGLVNIVTQGIQEFTVPVSGPYQIIAAGASGGGITSSFGCRGRVLQGETFLTAGQVLRIVVGQRGEMVNVSAGGGGGSYVVSGVTPILIAGGGAGYHVTLTGAVATSDGNYGNNGQAASDGTGPGGVGGAGGSGSNSGWGGGGAGFNSNGTNASACAGTGGFSFSNGAMGGSTCNNTNGGFGGGGATHGNSGGGGGGGGYSGGGGSTQNLYGTGAGGGGGSFQAPGMTNLADLGVNLGAGYVYITLMCNISVSSSANPICVGSAVTLSTNAVSGITWTGGGTGNSIVVSPSVTTTYSVAGTSSANCQAYSAITISVNVPNVTAAANINYSVCPSTPVILNGGGANTYTWSSGVINGVAFPSPSSTSVYTVTGTNTLTGCTNVATAIVYVYPTSISLSPSSSICSGSFATLSASGAMNYTWTGNNTTLPFQSPVVSPTSSAVYTVNAITSNYCPVSGTVAVTVNPSPVITAVSNKASFCKGESTSISVSGASTYLWSNGATTPSITVSPTVTSYYTVNGVSNNCNSNTASVLLTVNFCTSIDKNGLIQNNISVYPNPNNGEFTIKSTEAISLDLINQLGQVVKVITLNETNNHQASISNVANGIYFIVGKGNNSSINQKVIVNK